MRVADRGARLRQEALSGRREPHTAREPLEKRAAQLRLERRDLLRERGLGHKQPLGRLGEGSLLRDHGEVLELAQVHGIKIAYVRAREPVFELWAFLSSFKLMTTPHAGVFVARASERLSLSARPHASVQPERPKRARLRKPRRRRP